MDGTLARFFEPENPVERYREDGFFLSLRPYAGLVEALDKLRKSMDIVILSAVDDAIRESSVSQKTLWLDLVFPDSDIKAVFPPTGVSKAQYVAEQFAPIGEQSWLLDDYTANIVDWVNNGGRGIKAINEINGFGGKWDGKRVDICASAEEIYNDLIRIIC